MAFAPRLQAAGYQVCHSDCWFADDEDDSAQNGGQYYFDQNYCQYYYEDNDGEVGYQRCVISDHVILIVVVAKIMLEMVIISCGHCTLMVITNGDMVKRYQLILMMT